MIKMFYYWFLCIEHVSVRIFIDRVLNLVQVYFTRIACIEVTHLQVEDCKTKAPLSGGSRNLRTEGRGPG